MSLSTHVLDTGAGVPAANLAVRLELGDATVAEGRTDADGRISGWPLTEGVHRLVFDTAGHLGPDAFHPEVIVTFRVTDPAQHHHVPLLLSPFAYSTYRGS